MTNTNRPYLALPNGSHRHEYLGQALVHRHTHDGPHGYYEHDEDVFTRLPIHRTEAGFPRCATCDGGGCYDCTRPGLDIVTVTEPTPQQPAMLRTIPLDVDDCRAMVASEYWAANTAPGANGCIEWTGPRTLNGYGIVGKRGPLEGRYAHRVATVAILGRDLQPGLVPDHVCRNPPCVTPAHLLERAGEADHGRRACRVCQAAHGRAQAALVSAARIALGITRAALRAEHGTAFRALTTILTNHGIDPARVLQDRLSDEDLRVLRCHSGQYGDLARSI